MSWWRTLPSLLATEDLVLITVAKTQGSVPREAGASMLVTLTQTVDTIGGGHLEWEGIAQARAMLLNTSSTPELKRYALGATLGQCCGGVVWLVFERIAQATRTDWCTLMQQLACGKHLLRKLASTDAGSSWSEPATPPGLPLSGEEVSALAKLASPLTRGAGGVDLQLESSERWSLTQHLRTEAVPITIFGAGHVGAAIVRLLATLDARIRWVDQREDLLADAPPGVECIVSDIPEEAIANAPADSWFLVLTHNHALDLTLAEHILRRMKARNDINWFGLIGSHTKRARFEHRLQAMGLDPAPMTCPIGIAGIRDKSPAAIAIAVVAQILQEKETLAHRASPRTGVAC